MTKPCCKNCLWYYIWEASPHLPITECCAMHQNPTGAPCGLYKRKEQK